MQRRALVNDLTTEARIVAAYQSGDSIRAIAATYGMVYGSVRSLLLRQGVQLRGRGGDTRSVKPRDLAALHADQSGGSK